MNLDMLKRLTLWERESKICYSLTFITVSNASFTSIAESARSENRFYRRLFLSSLKTLAALVLLDFSLAILYSSYAKYNALYELF